MKKCPKCGNYSVSYDAYRGIELCMIDECSCHIIDENSFSYLEFDPSTGTMNRIKVEKDHEPQVVKQYDIAL
jgi:hypothetical protein